MSMAKKELSGVQDKRILIIDDDKGNVQFLKYRLQSMPHWKVATAQDGVEGLEMARALKPDLIILDLLLPKMSGFKVAEMIKKSRDLSQIPIIMISSIYDQQDIEECRKLGINEFFEKSDIYIKDSSISAQPFINHIKHLLGEKIEALAKISDKVLIIGDGLLGEKAHRLTETLGYEVKGTAYSQDLMKLKEDFVPQVLILCADPSNHYTLWLRQLKKMDRYTPMVVFGDEENQRLEALKERADGFIKLPCQDEYVNLLLEKLCCEAKLRFSEKLLRDSLIEKVHDLEKKYEELQRLKSLLKKK